MFFNVLLGAKLALRQKNEETTSTPTTTTVTPPITVTNNNTVLEPIKLDKQQENAHETKDSTKDADATKPKKEENIVKEPAKPQDKSRPISSTPVPGTPWYTQQYLSFFFLCSYIYIFVETNEHSYVYTNIYMCVVYVGVSFGRVMGEYFSIILPRGYQSGRGRTILLAVRMWIKWYHRHQTPLPLQNQHVSQIQAKAVMMISLFQLRK